MINDSLDLNEGRLRQAIDASAEARNPFSTIDVIKQYSGSYYTNKGVPVNVSLNAEIGRFLSRNSEALRIEKQEIPEKEFDDNSQQTTTAMWLKV